MTDFISGAIVLCMGLAGLFIYLTFERKEPRE